MKLKKWMYGALALGLFGACSNDDVPSGGGTTQVPDGYFAVNLQLPTQQGTRAGNDDYDDGTLNEYDVTNAAIVIFKWSAGDNDGKSYDYPYQYELDSKIIGAYVLYDLEGTPDADKDNITTQYTKVARVSGFEVEDNDKLYALAFLNYDNDIISIGESDGELKVGGNNFKGKTFKYLLEQTTDHNLFNGASKSADKFFMTNAPLSKEPGTTRGNLGQNAPHIEDVQVLAAFDKSKIADKDYIAKENPATSIYVERAVAKATLEWTPSNATIGGTPYPIKLWGWYVDNTEPKSYIVRNLGIGAGSLADYLGYTTGGNDYGSYACYRFAGTIPMGKFPNNDNVDVDDEPLLYRIYWCMDPQYTNTDPANPKNIYNTVFNKEFFTMSSEDQEKYLDGDLSYFKGTDYIYYPHENTFDVANQNFHNTTRAVFRMTLGVDENGNPATFYTLNGDEKNLYTDIDDVTAMHKAYLFGYGDDNGAKSEAGTVGGHNTDLRQAFLKALNPGESFKYDGSHVKITYKTVEGNYLVDNIILKVGKDSIGNDKTFKVDPNIDFQDKENATRKGLINYLNKTWKILEYKNGNCYYELRFMHFADEVSGGQYGNGDLAPWKWAITETDKSIKITDEAYGKDDSAEPYYLGRYGMVRNNWYALEIGAVNHLGSPVPPKVEGNVTSDDNKEVDKFIAVNVKVKAWAKRTQKHNF